MASSKNDWENWLSPEKGKYLMRIQKAVIALHEQDTVKGPLAFYTPHGPKHFKMVEDTLHKLIPDKEADDCFEEEERFYLLASAWLHDIGMYRSVASEVWGEELEDNEIRENHHTTSARFIVDNYTKCGLDEEDKEFLATLCVYHRRKENIEQCPREKSVGVGNKRFKLKLLAAYLRLSDSLDIGTYRTPTPAYAICLAYNMPHESKMHWIKNRIISGIFIDASNHEITVEFMEPKIDQQRNSYASDVINHKLNHVIDSVMQDLHEELNSVKQILISNGITYFLNIESTRNLEYVPEQIMSDLIEMVANYDILVHPSASRLLEMILQTIANITGHHLHKDAPPTRIAPTKQPKLSKIKEELDEFIDKISKELIKSRPCHYGLIKLIDQCTCFKDKVVSQKDIDVFVSSIAALFSKHHKYRRAIKSNASTFFDKHFLKDITRESDTPQISIILYGYSELTLKAICGFRSSLLKRQFPDNTPKDFFDTEIEFNESRKFRFFICEGQPKTITAPQDKLVYHDGVRYSSALEERNFTNIVMIPDAAVGTLLNSHNIDLIVIGANGFDFSTFVHSAGHASIINLALYKKLTTNCKKPYIVLTTTKEKFKSSDWKNKETKSNLTQIADISDSCVHFFKETQLSGREKIWFTRDQQSINQFCGKHCSIFNPREDVIPIKDLDFIISDKDWFPIKGGVKNPRNISDKINTFITAQQG